MSTFLAYTSVTALMFVGLLLIFIVLLQRGRGGGLAGALGGAGGQSALGTKAGDNFTKITIGLAAIWILLACLSIYALRGAVEGQVEALPDDPSAVATGEAPPVDDIADENAAETGAADTTPAEEPPADPPAESSSAPASEPAATDSAEGPSLGTPPDAEPAAPATESADSEK